MRECRPAGIVGTVSLFSSQIAVTAAIVANYSRAIGAAPTTRIPEGVVPMQMRTKLAAALVLAEGEVAGTEEPQTKLDGFRRHQPERLHAAYGLDLAGSAHQGDSPQAFFDHRIEFFDRRIQQVLITEALHAVGGVEEKPRGILDFFAGCRQGRPALEGTDLLGHDGAVDATALQQVHQQGRHHASVRCVPPHGRVAGAGHGGLDNAADRRHPARLLAGFRLELVDFRADRMAQPALDAGRKVVEFRSFPVKPVFQKADQHVHRDAGRAGPHALPAVDAVRVRHGLDRGPVLHQDALGVEQDRNVL